MEMIYIDSQDNARKTGVGAEFESPEETRRAFESARPLAVPSDYADYLLDLYDEDEDLVDTICLSRSSFQKVSGEKAKSDSEYIEIDDRFWSRLRSNGGDA